MRRIITIVAAGVALAAVPAMAHPGGGVGMGGGMGAGGGMGPPMDPGSRIGHGLDTAAQHGQADEHLDKAREATSRARERVQLHRVTRDQLQTGLTVRDSSGHRIGSLTSVTGDTARVTRGDKVYDLPVSQLYNPASRKAKEIVTTVPRASLTARSKASASSGVGD